MRPGSSSPNLRRQRNPEGGRVDRSFRRAYTRDPGLSRSNWSMVYEKAISGEFAAVGSRCEFNLIARAPRECVVREQDGHHQGKSHTVAMDESAFVPDGRRDR